MCSDFLYTMENFQGDLADIFRPNSGTSSSQDDHLPSIATAQANLVLTDWNLFQSSSSSTTTTTTTTDHILMESPLHHFGHPFNSIGDPLLEELDMSTGGPNMYCSSSTTTNMGLIAAEGLSGPFGGRKIAVDGQDHHHLHHPHPDHQRPPHQNQNNLFSRMLQISPNNIKPGPSSSSSSAASPSLLLSNNDMINANTSSKGCLVENTGLQISSPRNTGIKRRKSQAKKVVCIPAPAPVNSRPTGEVVPSDLWAWRKYGQKPIKGSPYPRGYYRCSSSKGCSARKQVERSRTDPNMLVITYTSEHNHPWPTQRNALAGSTRNQPSKTPLSSKTSPPRPSQSQKDPSLKEEQKDLDDTNMILSGSHTAENLSSPVGVPSMGRQPVGAPLMMEECRLVKEEREDDEVDKDLEMDDDEDGGVGGGHLGFPSSYRPALPESNHHHHYSHNHNPDQDFFADLGEIESDPLNHLLFSQGFSGVEERENSNKSLDPFSFYDWAATGNHNNNNNNNNSNNNSSTFGTEAKRLGGL